MKLVVDISEEEYNDCKMQVELIKQEGLLVESLNTALKIHVANGKPLEEELHREKEQTFEWCHDCKEYDQEAHCCHRWSKVIRTTIADLKAEMASEIIEQIEKMRQKEPYHFLPNRDAYNLFQKIVEDFRDGKGAWAERKDT